MKLDEIGRKFLQQEEGFRSAPYLDSVKVPTIGYGNTYYEDGTKVSLKDKPISIARGAELFLIVVNKYEEAVTKALLKPVTQNQFNALVSLAYNIGIPKFKSSTVLRLVNVDPELKQIGPAFEMWKNAKGKPILLNRRKREYQLYITK